MVNEQVLVSVGSRVGRGRCGISFRSTRDNRGKEDVNGVWFGSQEFQLCDIACIVWLPSI